MCQFIVALTQFVVEVAFAGRQFGDELALTGSAQGQIAGVDVYEARDAFKVAGVVVDFGLDDVHVCRVGVDGRYDVGVFGLFELQLPLTASGEAIAVVVGSESAVIIDVGACIVLFTS